MMAFTRQPEWFYDGVTEEVRDGPGGEVIGKAEPASGPLLAAAPELGNMEHDLSECSCESSLAGLLKHEYGAPPPRFETCPACELKNSLRLK